eukprot:UN11264
MIYLTHYYIRATTIVQRTRLTTKITNHHCSYCISFIVLVLLDQVAIKYQPIVYHLFI